MSIRWQVPPKKMQQALEGLIQQQRATLLAVGQRNGTAMQNKARQTARWTDRTGNARSGLVGAAESEGDTVEIQLAHTMDYGPALELARGGRYAIVWPTINAHLPELKRELEGMFGG